ncbi:STY13 [Scenedesmus sp. PABB004]|nr:STY13 [Scenedesmus sp. PABB004]
MAAVAAGGAHWAGAPGAGRAGALRRRAAPWLVPPLLLLLMMMMMRLAAAAPAGGDAAVAYIGGGSPTTLVEALQNSTVSRIELLGDYDAGPELAPYQGRAVNITRNVTISAAPGAVWPQLDLGFAWEAVELCARCVFAFDGAFAVANERRGTNPSFDLFVGRPGSVLLARDMYRLRLACTPVSESAETLLLLPRSPLLPGAAARQDVGRANVSYRGRDYPDSLLLTDVTFDVAATHDEGRGMRGGYAQGLTNVVRLCQRTATPECLLSRGSEVCIVELMDAALAEAAAAPPPRGLAPGALGAAIAVPLAAVALLGAALLVWRRRRRAASPEQKRSGFGPMQRARSMPGRTSRGSSGLGRDDSGGDLTWAGKGWELYDSFCSPMLPEGSERCDVELGELIGTGAYGRVYRARWRGGDVAVKCMEHDAAAVASVANEVHIVMSFASPYIVRAYACYTFVRTCANDSSGDEYSILAAPGPPGAYGGYGGLGGGAPLAPRLSSFSGALNLGRVMEGALAGGAAALPPTRSSGPEAELARLGTLSGSGGLETASGMHSSRSSGGRAAAADGVSMYATWLVQELCDRGTLRGYVARCDLPARVGHEPAAQRQLLLLLLDTARGLAALHARNVVHGDLCGRNVLVTSDADAPWGVRALISDLGLSRGLQINKTHHSTATLGTISHQAPELLRYGRLGTAADVYAWAITAWELWTGLDAFSKLSYGQFFQVVVLQDIRPLPPADMAHDYATLIAHAWATDPSDRPTMVEVIEALEHCVRVRTGEPQGGAPPAPPALLLRTPPARHAWAVREQAPPAGPPAGRAVPAAADGSTHSAVGGYSSSPPLSSYFGAPPGPPAGAAPAAADADAAGGPGPASDQGSREQLPWPSQGEGAAEQSWNSQLVQHGNWFV